MALQQGLGELLSAAATGGGALKVIELAWDAWKARGERRKATESREASDAELLHKSEVEFRAHLLERVRQLEEHDTAKSARIQELENENERLRRRIRQLEDSHGAT